MKWTRSLDDVLQISCIFLSKIVSGLKRTEPILRRKKLEEPIESNDNDTDNVDERKPFNANISAWDSSNEYLLSVLRLTIIVSARSVLLQLEPKSGRPGDGKKAWLDIQSKY